jgi:hypothetical protein
MAANSIPEALGLAAAKLEHYASDYSEEYLGTKQQLQAVGIGCSVLFPGEPEAKPRGITVRDIAGRRWQVRKASTYGAGLFRAERRRPKAEVAALHRQSELEKSLKWAISDEEEFRKYVRMDLDGCKTALRKAGRPFPRGSLCAFALPAAVVDRLEEVCDELDEIWLEFQECEVERNPEDDCKIRLIRQSQDLYANPSFRAVLSSVASDE